MPNIGFQELLIILLIAVILFGGRKIPEIGKGLGEGIRQFKQAIKGEDKAAPSSGSGFEEKKQA
jgi:sec-independent protein translocase protein TatA